LAAPVGLGPAPPQIKAPDLVVKKAEFTKQAVAPSHDVHVYLANIGDANAPATKLAVYLLRDTASGTPLELMASYSVPPIAKGHEAAFQVDLTGTKPDPALPKGIYLICLDCPVANGALGQVSEKRLGAANTTRPVAEVNNLLVCPVDPAAGLPKTIWHPGVCVGGF
jgi:hypothetical protein